MTQQSEQIIATSRMEAFAEAVSSCINASCLLASTVDYCPELRTPDMSTMSVYVVPTYLGATRDTLTDNSIYIDVAVIVASPAASSSDVSSLLTQVDGIISAMTVNDIAGASLQSIQSGPPSGESWLEDGIFVCAIEASYKWWA